jgi:hypothetical protein
MGLNRGPNPLLRTNIGLNIITKTFSKKLKPFLRMFIVSWCTDSPNIDPTMGVTIRSCVLGFSAVASIKYSQIHDCAVAKRKE